MTIYIRCLSHSMAISPHDFIWNAQQKRLLMSFSSFFLLLCIIIEWPTVLQDSSSNHGLIKLKQFFTNYYM
jgi:hypothetical protein